MYTPLPTRKYEDQIKTLAIQQHGRNPLPGALSVVIEFIIKKPKRPRVMRTHPCIRPDLDNLIKSIKDALNKIAWDDDCQICKLVSEKKYGSEHLIKVSVENMELAP